MTVSISLLSLNNFTSEREISPTSQILHTKLGNGLEMSRKVSVSLLVGLEKNY